MYYITALKLVPNKALILKKRLLNLRKIIATKTISIVTPAVLLLAFASSSHATILGFDQIRNANGQLVPTISGRDVENDYADRVNALSANVPGGQFTYGNAGEGFTPNVIADFFAASASPVEPAVSLWQDQYGDLTNVLIGDNNSSTLTVQLTADSGFEVQLHHFDLAGWPSTDYTINAVRVLGKTDTLFSQNNVLVEGNVTGNQHTSFDFANPLSAADLSIQIDYSNLPGGQHDNLGIDNIRFGQTPPGVIPLPSAWLLLGTGLAGIALRRYRKP